MDQTENHHYAVILAGGEGTRFVPLSTPEKPKQFLNILDEKRTMIRQTCDRLCGLFSPDKIYVSTNSRYLDLAQTQLPDVPESNFIGEPLKKNTAPAVGLLSKIIFEKDPKAVLIFLPADHFVHNNARAREVFLQALSVAEKEDVLVTFGVPPTFPSPDYGYIKANVIPALRNDGGREPIFGSPPSMLTRGGDDKLVLFEKLKVERFVEKPDVETAKKYITDGHYFWNSGMFVWRAEVILEAFGKYLPEMYVLLQAHFEARSNPKGPFHGKHEARNNISLFFDKVQSISIDYGIMEKADNVVMLPFDAGWSDVGTWKGLADMAKRFQISLPEKIRKYLTL